MTTAALVEPTIDPAKVEAFAHRLIDALNGAALMIMTSVGHRTGLFDALARNPNCRAEELAAASGLAPRYVREWLAVMATSHIVDYTAATETFSLPAEHGALLTCAAHPANFAVTSQFIGVIAAVEDRIVAAFQSGEGLDYHHYGRFHEVMAEDSAQSVTAALEEHILPIVPKLTERLRAGICVADVGCGGGSALLQLARMFPESRFTGFDLCADAFASAKRTIIAEGLTNIIFDTCDHSADGVPGSYDLITAFDAVHDQKDPQGLLCAVRAALRKDGVFLMQDIGGSGSLAGDLDHPFAPFLYTMSTMHCTPVSLAQGGPGIGTMWGVELAQKMLKTAGFGRVRMHRLAHDPVNAYFVAQA